MPMSVPHTMSLTISPDILASRPTTIFPVPDLALRFMNVAYAVVNFTMSSGFSVSPVRPPMVPRIPDMDFISVI